METTWKKEELRAYILLYCAHADLEESQDETLYIQEKLKSINLENMRSEFEKDNDYISIQKIVSTLKRYNFSKEELSNLQMEIKELFMADKKFSTLEKVVSINFSKILNSI